MTNFFKTFMAAALFVTFGVGVASAMPTNTDFESGALSPWYQDADFSGGVDWEITGSAISGSFSAFDIGNKRLRQDFTGVATDDILSITFNLLRGGHTANAYNFFYDDGTLPEFIASGSDGVVEFVDVTANLAAGKTLVGFGLYGNSGGSTTFDDFTITLRQQQIPAPAALGLLGLGLLGLGMATRRRR